MFVQLIAVLKVLIKVCNCHRYKRAIQELSVGYVEVHVLPTEFNTIKQFEDSFLLMFFGLMYHVGNTKLPSCAVDQVDMSLVVRKPVFGVSDQVRHKPGRAVTEDG